MENQGYIETAILGADRIELIRILYRGAITAVHEARKHLANGEIMARSKSISRALDFVSELALSLNHEAGGALSQRLADLYEYIQQLLLQAHAGKSDEKLAEALRILETLLNGWTELKPAAVSTAPSPTLETPIAEPQSELPPTRTEAPGNPYAGDTTETKNRSWDF